MHLRWLRNGLAGFALALLSLASASDSKAQVATQPSQPAQAGPPMMGPPPLDPDVQRYLYASGLDIILLRPDMLTNVDPDLGPMRNFDICDVAAARFADYRNRRAEFELGKQKLLSEIGPVAYDDVSRRAYEDVLPSIMAQKSCQSGEVHFNSNEYLRERLTPADTISNCKALRVPGWLIQAVIDSKRDMKVVDLVCLDIERLSIYGRKLDLLRISGSRISYFTMQFSEIAGSFLVEGSTTDNVFEVRWNTIKDIYVNFVTAMSYTGRELFSIQNNTIGNGLEINNLVFGRNLDYSNDQHGQPMRVISNRIGSDLIVVNSDINGALNLADTTANGIRLDNTVVAGEIFVEATSAEKVIVFRNGMAGGGVIGHYLHAEGIEFRAFRSVRNIDFRSSQFADKILLDDVNVDRVQLHDVMTRPLLIYDARIAGVDIQGMAATLVHLSSNVGGSGNRIGLLTINDSRIESTTQVYDSYFWQGLSITNTSIGNSLSLVGGTVFRDNAWLDIRAMKTDGLNIDLSVLDKVGRDGDKGRLLIRSDGAVFNRFGTLSGTGRDLSDLSVSELLCHFSLSVDDAEERPGVKAGATSPCLLNAAWAFGALSPPGQGGASPAGQAPGAGSGGAVPPAAAAESPATQFNYRAEEFDQLAAVLERSGRGDKARDIKIAKNRAYAEASDSWLTRGIYRIAGFVNGYGYNNQFALMLYFACVLAGMVLFWLWLNGETIVLAARLARSPKARTEKRRLLGRIGELRRQKLTPEAGRSLSVYRRDGGLIYAFFFSLDRSLPPLNLDSAFATHEGMWRPLAYWFFFQRAFCFLVLSLVLAGSLGMFQ